MTRRSVDLNLLDGLTPYDDGHALQLSLVERRKAGEICDTLVLLEHPPVITMGRYADDRGLLAAVDEIEAAGLALRHVERGGQATYHGPGQIVGYPIVNLHGLGLGVAAYVRGLEQVMIDAAAGLGIEAFRQQKLTGVFTVEGKIGAIGVRVTRGVTYHGFAFNVEPDLDHYRFIVPCGMTGIGVTSVRALTGEQGPSFEDARSAIVEAFLNVFDFERSARDIPL
jgi:lipoate-protein ligase B